MEFRILVEYWNIYEYHNFLRSLVQTCWLETTSLCLNTRLSLNKNFQILIFFIEFEVKFYFIVFTPSDKYNLS